MPKLKLRTITLSTRNSISLFVAVAVFAVMALNQAVQANEIDTAEPVITLNGDAAITVVQGDDYEDLGATAIDDVDGAVAVLSTADEFIANKAGENVVSYVAMDSSNNVAFAHRTVTIITPAAYYGAATAVIRASTKSAIVSYANGDTKTIPLPYHRPSSLAITDEGNYLVVLGKNSKHIALVDPYTGSVMNSVRARAVAPTHSKLRVATLARVDEDHHAKPNIVLASMRDNRLTVTVWKVSNTTHRAKKIASITRLSQAKALTPLRVRVAPQSRRIIVHHGKHEYRWRLTARNTLLSVQ